MSFDLGSVIVKIKSDLAGFDDGISKAKQGMKSLESGLKDVRNGAAIVTGALTAVGVASLKFGEVAGKYESIRGAFESMTKGMGLDADEFQTKVADASRGTLDKLTILQGATRALSLIGKDSFKDFGNDFAEMAEYSKKAARATGQDVTYMFDSLITGISRESKMILDNLGITVDITEAKEKYGVVIEETADGMAASGDKAALLQYTMDKLKDTYGEVATSGGGFAGAMSTLKTTFKDAQIEIGTALLPALNEMVRAFTPIVKEYVPQLIAGISSLIEWFKGLSPEMQTTLGVLTALAPIIMIVTGLILAIIPVITALLSPIGLVIAIITALYIAWQNNFFGVRDITTTVIGHVMAFFNDTFMPFFQMFIDWFTERWDFIKMIIQGTWDIIVGLIKVAWAIVFGIISTGMEVLSGDWKGAWDRIKQSLSIAWGGIKQIFVGILEFLTGWGGTLVNRLTSPFTEAWNKIKEVVEKIKDSMDFTKRNSPSVIDIIQNGVRLANKAFEGLEFNTNLIPNVAVSTAQAANPSNTMIGVTIDMDGAIISSRAAAEEMSEFIGDNIINRLQQNIRI